MFLYFFYNLIKIILIVFFLLTYFIYSNKYKSIIKTYSLKIFKTQIEPFWQPMTSWENFPSMQTASVTLFNGTCHFGHLTTLKTSPWLKVLRYSAIARVLPFSCWISALPTIVGSDRQNSIDVWKDSKFDCKR